jgi:hypothetical protein
MQFLGWFRTSDAEAFGHDLADFMIRELEGKLTSSLDAKAKKKAERVMRLAEGRVQDFRAKHSLNFFKRAKAANAFLWKLKDAGWPLPAANQMTDWLTMRL